MKRLASGVLFVTATILGAAPALAQQSQPDLTSQTLEDLMKVLITTASRTSESLADAPAAVEVVTAKEIRDRGYRSLFDVLRDRSRIAADFGGDPDFPAQLTIEGTRGSNRIVVLLDGVRISSPTGEPLPILGNYPVHAAKQIEIVYGPASALYGADAFSGVINIVSQDVPDAEGLTVGTSFGRFGLWNQTASFGTYLGQRMRLVVNGQVFRDRQPDMSRYYPADFRDMAAQRAGVFNTIFGTFTAAPAADRYEAPVAAHSIHATLRTGGLQLTFFQNRSRLSTSYAYDPDNGVYDESAFSDNRLAVASAAYTRTRGRLTSTSMVTASRHELMPESGYWNVFSNMARSYKYAYGAMLKGEQQLAWQLGEHRTLIVGGTFEQFHAIPQGADLNAPRGSHSQPGTIRGTTILDEDIDLHYSNTGAFAQVHQDLGTRVTATIGGRADYNSRYGATFNPRLGVVARLRATTVRLMYGTAYLAPSPYQAYGHYGSFYSLDGGKTYASDFWQVPNPDLKPEHKRTVEASLAQRLGPNVNVTVSAFSTLIRNLIQQSDNDPTDGGLYLGWPVADLDATFNAGHQHTLGATFDANFLKTWGSDRRINARFGITLVDGHVSAADDGQDLPIGEMVPVRVTAGVDADLGRWTGTIRVDGRGTQRVLALAEVDGSPVRKTLDGYRRVDLSLRRRSVFKNVDLFATIENVLDARYRHINARAYTNPEELIGAPQVPRRVSVGFELRVK